MGDSMRSTVRKAARLAVYEEMMISVKNHQMPPTILVERALGMSSEPNENQGEKMNRAQKQIYFTVRIQCYCHNGEDEITEQNKIK